MHTSGPRRLPTGTLSVALLSLSVAVTAASAGAESAPFEPVVPTTQSLQASPADQPVTPPGVAPFDPFSSARSGERSLADQCSESTLTRSTSTAHCESVIYALSERPLDAEQSWELAAALNNRALSRNRTRDVEGAIGDLTAAINVMPQWAELYVNRGNLYLKTAAHAAALADYEQAARLSGGRLDAVLFNRAFLQRALGQPKRAEEELLRWQATVPSADQSTTDETVEPISGDW